MAAFDVYDHTMSKKESIDLDDSVFSVPVNDFFLHQVLLAYQANKRQGTHKAKNRSEVHGTNSKPFRQKGTGRARQGIMHAAHHRHGARQFGPQPRSYRQKISKKMKQEAYRQVLSLHAGRGGLHVLQDLAFPEAKTKTVSSMLKSFETEGRALFLDVNPEDNALLSIRNIPHTSVLPVSEASPLDLFESDHLFLTRAAAELLVQRYAKGGTKSE